MTKKVLLTKNAEEVAKVRYFRENEDWEGCSRRVADTVSSIEQDRIGYSEKFAEAIYNMDFLPGGRILRNSGRPKGSLLNCFHLGCSDSIEEIGEFMKSCLILWSEGGGCGVNMSNLRPAGDPILGKGGQSSGMVSFLVATDAIAKTIESGGQRRAAGIASLDVSHPEILKFIDSKNVHGEISHFNISVMVNDQFIEAVELDKTWDLKFKQKVYQTVRARDIWDKIIHNMIYHAEPGLINSTNFKKNNSWYFDPVTGVNPCHTGDTMVAVADGRKLASFKQLSEENKDVPVFSLNRETNQIEVKMMRNPRKTGVNQKILKVTLDNGMSFRANETHKITMFNGEQKCIKELSPNDRLHHMIKYEANLGTVLNTKQKQRYVWMSSGFQCSKTEHRLVSEFLIKRPLQSDEVVHHKDYNYQNNAPQNLQVMKKIDHDDFHRKDKMGNKNPIHRFPEKNYFKNHKFVGVENGNSKGFTFNEMIDAGKNLVKKLNRKASCEEWKIFCEKNGYPYSGCFLNKFGSIGNFLSFVSNETGVQDFDSFHFREYIKFLEIKNETDLDIFWDNGIYVKKRCGFCNSIMILKWGNREQKYCSVQCIGEFKKINQNKDHVIRKQFSQQMDLNFKVLKVEEDGAEDVYNGTVDDNHNYYIFVGEDFNKHKNPRLNFINSKNCGEVTLSPWTSCCLGSLVLPNFITGNINTNWQKLERTIKLAVRFLDNVIDLNNYTISKIDQKSHDGRRIGLGVTGLADYLFAKKVRYGSKEAIAEVEKLCRFIRDASYQASIELATEKGSFPKFDPIMFGKSSFVRKLPGSLRMDIKNKGIRNVTLLSYAPTGTISLIASCNSGIEPLTFKSYKRVDRVSERVYIHPKYKELLLSGEKVPEWFVDASDLTPIDHFETQAAIQKYTDGSISKTANFPKGTTEDELSDYLLEYIHDLKGTTVYVDGTREGQVYNQMSEEDVLKILKEENEQELITNTLEENDIECKTCVDGVCQLENKEE